MGPLGALNPQRLWIVVVVTGSISFIGYVLSRWVGERRGTLLTAAVGALVSSTAVTIDAARRVREGAPGAVSNAAVAVASTVMLARSLVLVTAIAPAALAGFAALVLPGLAVSALGSAILLYRARGDRDGVQSRAARPPGLKLAFLFALTVAALSLASAWAQHRWGGDSGAILIAIGGVVDIDAAIAAVGAMPAGSLPLAVAALALAAPTFFNTLFKLCLFVGIAGRNSVGGALSLIAASLALLIPIAIALAAR